MNGTHSFLYKICNPSLILEFLLPFHFLLKTKYYKYFNFKNPKYLFQFIFAFIFKNRSQELTHVEIFL